MDDTVNYVVKKRRVKNKAQKKNARCFFFSKKKFFIIIKSVNEKHENHDERMHALMEIKMGIM